MRAFTQGPLIGYRAYVGFGEVISLRKKRLTQILRYSVREAVTVVQDCRSANTLSESRVRRPSEICGSTGKRFNGYVQPLYQCVERDDAPWAFSSEHYGSSLDKGWSSDQPVRILFNRVDNSGRVWFAEQNRREGGCVYDHD